MSRTRKYTLGTLAPLLDAELIGDPDCEVDGLATLATGRPGKLCFLSNPAYVGQLQKCAASAVLLEKKFVPSCPVNKLVTSSPYLSFARATELFDDAPDMPSGVHATAQVDPGASLGENAVVGAYAVIEAGVTVGAGCVIGSGCYLGHDVVLGKACRLHSNVTIYHRVKLGDRVCVHAGAVLGADGFGFAFDGEKSVKIRQLGSVLVGDDVDIGAGTTIDRGAIEDTVIEQGVKIDNQVQIGHNCVIGEHTVICGCTAIAGSAVIGKYCVLGGASGVVGHITIADRVRVSAMSLVSRSISKPGDYSSGTGIANSARWRRNIVRFNQLDDIMKRLQNLEKQGDS